MTNALLDEDGDATVIVVDWGGGMYSKSCPFFKLLSGIFQFFKVPVLLTPKLLLIFVWLERLQLMLSI